jgi:hypothetical protein
MRHLLNQDLKTFPTNLDTDAGHQERDKSHQDGSAALPKDFGHEG